MKCCLSRVVIAQDKFSQRSDCRERAGGVAGSVHVWVAQHRAAERSTVGWRVLDEDTLVLWPFKAELRECGDYECTFRAKRSEETAKNRSCGGRSNPPDT